MTNTNEGAIAYEDIGPKNVAAGWRFENVRVTNYGVVVTYQRVVDGIRTDKIIIGHHSGDSARRLAILEMSTIEKGE